MIELIFFIVFILSLGGIFFIVAKKIPVLNTLPQNGHHGIKKHHIVLDIETKIKNILLYIEKQIYLHKFLSFLKVTVLRLETIIDKSLQKIRKKAQEKK